MKLIFIFLLFFLHFNLHANIFVDLSSIKEGEYRFVNWIDVPVLIFHRTQNQIDSLNSENQSEVNLKALDSYAIRYGNRVANSLLRANYLNTKKLRSKDDKWFISLGASPEFGLKIKVDKELGILVNLHDGSIYDLAGKVIYREFNKKDLSIPDYNIMDDVLVIYTEQLPNEVDFSEGKIKTEDPPEKQVIDALLWSKFDVAESILDKYPQSIQNTEVSLKVLIFSVIYNKKKLLEKAIKYGVNINSLFPNNSTPLNTAILSNNMELAKYLVNKGATIDSICRTIEKNNCSKPTMELLETISEVDDFKNFLIKKRNKK